MKYVFFRLTLFIFILLFSIDYLNAGGKNNDIDFNWSLETKGVYSSGISESYAYNLTGAKASYKVDYLEIASHFYQYFNYQVTDGNGVYDYRSFTEAGASLEIDVYKYFLLFFEYSRSEDFKNISTDYKNLTKNIYNGNIEFEIASTVLSAGYSYEEFQYWIDSNQIESVEKDFYIGVDYLLNDTIGLDLTYTYSALFFSPSESEYNNNIVRAGCMYVPSGYIFIIAGAGGGRDSEKYNIYGTDFGMTFIIHPRFKMTFRYFFNYYDPTVTDSYASSSGSGSGSGNSSGGKRNPYLLSAKEGESYISHVFNLGITASF